jgi:hypothetical protein
MSFRESGKRLNLKIQLNRRVRGVRRDNRGEQIQTNFSQFFSAISAFSAVKDWIEEKGALIPEPAGRRTSRCEGLD